jgi:predicted metal-dependent HD superfamily phosphohydrolase
MEGEYQVFSLQLPLHEEWISMMNTAYSQSHRKYHTLTHVQSMLKQLQAIDKDFSSEQLQILRLAIWFHDVVYDIPSEPGYNECFSVLKFQGYVRDAGLV